jgi:hypothetical protein
VYFDCSTEAFQLAHFFFVEFESRSFNKRWLILSSKSDLRFGFVVTWLWEL